MIECIYGSVAQLVEQRPEEPRVTGSSPVGTTIKRRPVGSCFYGDPRLDENRRFVLARKRVK